MVKQVSLITTLIFLLLVAIAARAEEQVQAPVFEEGNNWKFNVIQKAPPNYALRNELWNGIYIIRYVNGRIAVRKLIDEKPVVSETSPAMFLGFRPGSQEHTLDFPLSVAKQWRYSYKFR